VAVVDPRAYVQIPGSPGYWTSGGAPPPQVIPGDPCALDPTHCVTIPDMFARQMQTATSTLSNAGSVTSQTNQCIQSMARDSGGGAGGCGTYAGVVGGYGTGNSSQTDSGISPPPLFRPLPPPSTPPPPPPGDGSFSTRGGFVGGTLGYNLPLRSWLLGVEADYSGANITGSSASCGGLQPHGCGTTLQSFGTVRGRFGHDVGAWLPYLTAGLAVGEVHAWDALTPASGSTFRVGWTVGGGIEVPLMQSLTMKIEYLYMDLGSAHLFDIVPGLPESVSFRTSLFRVGFNYQFSSAPEPSTPKPLIYKN
jgi:outer membrane immunogenic protein